MAQGEKWGDFWESQEFNQNFVSWPFWTRDHPVQNLWIDSTRTRTHDLSHSRLAHYPLALSNGCSSAHLNNNALNMIAGLSFEAGCRRNSTSTLYSAAGYLLCIKDKKCVIYSQSRYRDNDHVFFSFHYQSLITVTTIDLSIVNNASQTGRKVAVFHWPAKVWYPWKRILYGPLAWTNFIDRPKTSRPWLYLIKHHKMSKWKLSFPDQSSIAKWLIKEKKCIF